MRMRSSEFLALLFDWIRSTPRHLTRLMTTLVVFIASVNCVDYIVATVLETVSAFVDRAQFLLVCRPRSAF